MKIAYISNPNSTHTRRWATWFHLAGHQVLVIADTALTEPWVGMELRNLPAQFKLPVVKYLVWSWQTRRTLADWHPDILHAHRVTAAGWIGMLSGFHPLVVTPWGSDLYQFPQRSSLAAWLTRRVLESANLVTADSQDLLHQAVCYGADPQHSHLIQWGVDRSMFQPSPSPHLLKERWDLAGRIVIYSPRNMHPLYNLDILIEAAPAILARYPSAMFVLRDLNADPAYRRQILAAIEERNLGDSVRIIGRMQWEETISLSQLADLVISIPSSDGTPVSVLEAMACGAPVIASDLPSLREWISHQENGLLVPVRDAAALESAILEALERPEKLQAFTQANLEIIAQRADHQLEMQKMEALYHRLLPHQPRGPSEVR